MILHKNQLHKLPAGYIRPAFDIDKLKADTIATPTWLHMGVGNIFRGMIASMQQDLIEKSLTTTGIIAYEAFDPDIIIHGYTPYAGLTINVTLQEDGEMDKRVIASVPHAMANSLGDLCHILAAPTLQMVSLTITENGYKLDMDNVCTRPNMAKTTLEQLTAGLYQRFRRNREPIAIVSFDNFSRNGTVVKNAIAAIARHWYSRGNIPLAFLDFLNDQSYPWTMIDKITPSPSQYVATQLTKDGMEDMLVFQTSKNSQVAPFVNGESSGYLVIDDKFPNGRPPLEKAGAHMTTREIVSRMDHMKVCALLNPLHTILAVAGSLLQYPTIAACMQDQALVNILRQAAAEAMPTVEHPGIVSPTEFLEEVLTKRFTNPFIPDTPQRIATGTSQKIPIRFGRTLTIYRDQQLDMNGLSAIPLTIALWLRYLTALDDHGYRREISPDPLLPAVFLPLKDLQLGDKLDIGPMLRDVDTFGIDLTKHRLGAEIQSIFDILMLAPGNVAKVIQGHA